MANQDPRYVGPPQQGGGPDPRYIGPAQQGGGGGGGGQDWTPQQRRRWKKKQGNNQPAADGRGGAYNFQSIGGGGAPPESGFMSFLENQLMDRIGGGFGIDPATAAAQRAALTSQSHNQQMNAMQALTAQLNASGALGGGREIALNRDLATSFNDQLLNQLAQFDMGLNQMMLQDRQAAFGEGGNFANTRTQQQLGLGDINARNRATSAQFRLGQIDDRTRRDLGFAQLDESAAGRGQQASQFDRSFGLQQQGQQFNQGLTTFLTNMGLLGLG